MAENDTQITLPEQITTLTSDPAVQVAIEALLRGSAPDKLEKSIAKKVKAAPRFVFTESGTPRVVDGYTQVSNPFEQRGGKIIRKLSDTASLVLVDDKELVVHEPEEAWGQ